MRTGVEKALIDIERRELFLAEGQKWPNLSKLSLKQSELIQALCGSRKKLIELSSIRKFLEIPR